MKEKKQAIFVEDGNPCTVIVETPPAEIMHDFKGMSANVPHKIVRIENGEELAPENGGKNGLFKTVHSGKVVRIL